MWVHFSSVEPLSAHTGRMPTATRSMEVHVNPSFTQSIPSTDYPLATLFFEAHVAHLVPGLEPCLLPYWETLILQVEHSTLGHQFCAPVISPQYSSYLNEIILMYINVLEDLYLQRQRG